MRKPIATLVIALTLVASLFAFTSQSTLAASPAQEYCEDVLGGDYDKQQGEVICTIVVEENVGNSPNSQTVLTDDSVTSNGTFNNRPQKEVTDTCVGPGNSGDGSNHCT